MKINLKKIGQFFVDYTLNTMEDTAKGVKKATENKLKRKDLTEEQREILEEKLEEYGELEYGTKNMKYYYHSDYKDEN